LARFRLRVGLAAKFAKSNVFMDVDKLRACQRFDVELAKALDACDAFVAVITDPSIRPAARAHTRSSSSGRRAPR
jgi:hypothetical protein